MSAPTGPAMPAGTIDGTLAGRYRLDERIAVGGMGEVWRGQDTLLGRLVAVKCLKPEYVGDAEFSERFRAEARHAAGLSHPGIASVYDYGEQTSPEPAAWLVMELVDGEPLSSLLHRAGALDPVLALDIVGQAALALGAAHAAGVIHRDVKPGNLLVRPDGVIKVTDFGIARATDAVPLTRTGTVVGTAYYLSPEQASGRPTTPASDVYSLGVVAYECLAGRRPFPGDNAIAVATAHLRDTPPPLPDTIPVAVRQLVEQAMEKDPAARPAHAGEFGETALALKAGLSQGDAGTTVLVPVLPPPAAHPPGAADQTRALTTVTPAPLSPAPARVAPTGPATTVAPTVPATAGGDWRRWLAALPAPGRNHQRAVRLAAALLAVVLVALSLRACGSGTARTTVPRIAAGSTVAAATSTLHAAHLKADQRSRTSTTVAAGRVLGTQPTAGSAVDRDSTVILLVSSGRPKVTVVSSAYVGKPAADVRAALTALGLKPSYAYDGSGGPAGTVRSVSPAGALAYGSAVTISVVPAPAPAPAKPAPRKHKGKKG